MMNIPQELKDRLLSELDYIIEKIKTETDTKRKLYFLSAAHGAIERTMRFHSDGELYLIHFTLNLCYSTIGGLLNRIGSGDMAVIPPGNLWERVLTNLDELSAAIYDEVPSHPILEKIAILTYTLTGPGYYTTNYLKSLEPSDT